MENKLHSTISAPQHLHTLKQIVKLKFGCRATIHTAKRSTIFVNVNWHNHHTDKKPVFLREEIVEPSFNIDDIQTNPLKDTLCKQKPSHNKNLIQTLYS